MFGLKVGFSYSVKKLYVEMTLVLQILYCLGSPVHGPPTGFLRHRGKNVFTQQERVGKYVVSVQHIVWLHTKHNFWVLREP